MNERKLTKSELAKREDIIMKMKDNKRALVQKYGKDAEAVMYGRATNLAKKEAKNMDQDKIKELVKDALQNPKKADLNKDGKLSDYEKKRGAAIEKSMVDEIDLDLKGGTEKDKDADIAGVVGAESALGLEENLNESKEAGLDELKSIIDQASALGEEARSIIEAYFPSYSAQGEAYGVFDFVESSNPYDTTLVTMVEEIEADEDSYEDEDLNEDLDLGHQDDEPHMLKADLYRIGKYAMDLYQMMDEFEGQGEVDFPHWWQSKIINAKTALVGAKHYLDFEVKEPSIDAVVDKIDDVAPEMEIDVVDENIDKVELPSTTATKANTAITTAPTMAKVLLKMYNQLQDKEQSDFSKNPDFNIALKKLQGLANQVKESKSNIAEKLAKQLKSK